jgi:uncharacterized protein YlxW (UPF0749 family)
MNHQPSADERQMRLRMSRLRAPARPDRWRLLVPLVALGAGLLLVASANTARGTDLRAPRSLRISELVSQQQRDVARLTAEAKRLRTEISAATALAGVGDARVQDARRAADDLAPAAGLTTLRGPALTVALDDAPRAAQQRALAAGASPDDLVIHQQDLQAVVNALWAGGARGMTIMGERVVATTAVRCVGNSLLLQGRVYPPPYVVTAVGDPARMRAALDASPDIQVFRQYVAAFGLGLQVHPVHDVTLPAYAGPLELSHAKAVS